MDERLGGRARDRRDRAAGVGAWWRTSRTQPHVDPRPFLTRLTSDLGWTDYPAISLDGKILAYASDRSGDGNLDIWVQQIPDGAPRQADPSRRRRCRSLVLG